MVSSFIIAFRFHTGSIKSHHRMRKETDPVTQRFDSILVRLKDDQMKEAVTLFAQFRFHTGSIKSFESAFRQVRMQLLFRFHTGSIKRYRGMDRRERRIRFRFHTGSIKSHENAAEAVAIMSFDSILVRLKGFMKTVNILYRILMVRVKSFFTNAPFKMNLQSTSNRANSLGGRRILTGQGFRRIFFENCDCDTISYCHLTGGRQQIL